MKSKPFIILSGFIVLAVGAFSAWLNAVVPHADKFTTSVLSPDKHMKAVRMSVAGGGEKTPFCYDSISVMLAVYPDEFAEKGRIYEIYNAPCEPAAARRASPTMEWLSPTALRVTHARADKLRTKDIDVTKTVHMTFVEK